MVFAGGICGRTYYLLLCDSYNTGDVSAMSKNHSQGSAGGILGNITAESVVRRCYSSGSVAASQNPGGVIGMVEEGSVVKDAFWNSAASQTKDSVEIVQADKKGVRIVLPADHIGAESFSADAAPAAVDAVDKPPVGVVKVHVQGIYVAA